MSTKTIRFAPLLFIAFVFLFSCKKESPSIGGITGPSTVCYAAQQVTYAVAASSAVDYISWSVPEGATITEGQGTSQITVNFGIKTGLVTARPIKNNTEGAQQQISVTFGCVSGTWCRLLNFQGTARYCALGFSANNKGYVLGGLGTNISGGTGTPLTDVWEYDQTANSWTQKSSIGVQGLNDGNYNYFVINNILYMLRSDTSAKGNLRFISYDPAVNVWSYKADFPGMNSYQDAGCFAAGGKGYVCCGPTRKNVAADSSYELKTVWQYDPAVNLWTRKGDFPGEGRAKPMAFSLNNSGYVGTGFDNFNNTVPVVPLYDFWKYDALADSWTRLNDVGFNTTGPGLFSLQNEEYAIAGYNLPGGVFLKSSVKYNPVGDTWTSSWNFPGNERDYVTTFVINNTAYLGLGFHRDNSANYFLGEFYSFCQ